MFLVSGLCEYNFFGVLLIDRYFLVVEALVGDCPVVGKM